jgi:hypothetical protein
LPSAIKSAVPPEVEIRKCGSEVGHERVDIAAAAAGFMQRVFQQHVRGGDLVDNTEIHGLAQNSVKQRPTTALLSSSLLIGKVLDQLGNDHWRASVIYTPKYGRSGRTKLRFWSSNRLRFCAEVGTCGADFAVSQQSECGEEVTLSTSDNRDSSSALTCPSLPSEICRARRPT